MRPHSLRSLFCIPRTMHLRQFFRSKSKSRSTTNSASTAQDDILEKNMPDSKPTVAIFGASGHLGMYITQAFLEINVRQNFQKIVLFVRHTSKISPAFTNWENNGLVTVRKIATTTVQLTEQLADVDIVVNAVNSEGDALRTEIVQAMVGRNIKLYIPSEFGVDHTLHDFSHPEWDKKKKHFELANELLKHTKICRIYCGLFLEDSVGPWFGFDTKNGQYECYGSSREKVTFTSLVDVGSIVANLASMPLEQIPLQLHFSGDLVSVSEIANVMRNKSKQEILCVERPLQENKRKELSMGRPDPSGCLRFLMGEGKIRHAADGVGCDNNLVNPDQEKWTWKTMADLANETNGRPWADATWT